MENFTYYAPTEVVFGRGVETETARLVKKYGGSRAFVVYGGGSVVRSGLLERVEQNLREAGLEVCSFGGAKPNPTLSHAREGVRRAVAFGTDFVLAVGGGSAIDTAKAIAHGAANADTDIWQFWNRDKVLTRSTPVGVILTIPAAGSEMSNSAVLTNEETDIKRGLSTDLNRPKFAVMNPELTFTLPRYQIACGVTDIMMHTMERYFNPVDNALTDALAEALLRTVVEMGRRAVADSRDYEAMSELMWAGSLSHNGLTGLGGNGDWSVHQLGHALSAKFDLAHGASLAAVWGSWAAYVRDARPERFARYARNVWGVTEPDDDRAGQLGIQATVDCFAALGMPTGLAACVGVQGEQGCLALADLCSYGRSRTIGTLRKLDWQDMDAIYRMADR